ncbi:MAG: hypothetical protein FJZ15_02070 [Candidatus Omnitrophica bacterium]|nr:hypothetical protein [Candidatus Omnitrophota bacterium]
MGKRLLVLTAVFLLGIVTLCSAATNIRIAASVGEIHQMNVVLNKVVGSTWTPIANLAGEGMDFGSLTKGTDNVFRSTAYFVVDAPVTSNRSTWTITHSASDFTNGTSNLNTNTNVKFVKVDNSTNAESQLASNGFISYQLAKTRAPVQSTELTGGRLRLYYSLAGGSGDASGVSVITTSTPTGTYTGTVTLTLSP